MDVGENHRRSPSRQSTSGGLTHPTASGTGHERDQPSEFFREDRKLWPIFWVHVFHTS